MPHPNDPDRVLPCYPLGERVLWGLSLRMLDDLLEGLLSRRIQPGGQGSRRASPFLRGGCARHLLVLEDRCSAHAPLRTNNFFPLAAHDDCTWKNSGPLRTLRDAPGFFRLLEEITKQHKRSRNPSRLESIGNKRCRRSRIPVIPHLEMALRQSPNRTIPRVQGLRSSMKKQTKQINKIRTLYWVTPTALQALVDSIKDYAIIMLDPPGMSPVGIRERNASRMESGGNHWETFLCFDPRIPATWASRARIEGGTS